MDYKSYVSAQTNNELPAILPQSSFQAGLHNQIKQ